MPRKTKPTNPPKCPRGEIGQMRLTALWMRAVANCCGYNPGMAKALGVAYAWARDEPKLYEAHAVKGHIKFAGLWFVEPVDDEIESSGLRFDGEWYDVWVRNNGTKRGSPEDHALHDKLFYRAVDIAEELPFARIDATSLAYDRLIRELGGRPRVSVGAALEAIEGTRRSR